MTHQAIYRSCCCFPCDIPGNSPELPDTLKISGSVSAQYKTCRKFINYDANSSPLCSGGQIEISCVPVSVPSPEPPPPPCDPCQKTAPTYPNVLEWERESLMEVRYSFTGLLYKLVDFFGRPSYRANMEGMENPNSVNISWEVNLSVSGEDWKTTLDCVEADCCANGCLPFIPEFPIFCEGTQSVNDFFSESGDNWYPPITLRCDPAPLIDIINQKENCNWINFDVEDFQQNGIYFGKLIPQIVIQGPGGGINSPIQWPPFLENCPGQQLVCDFFNSCNCEYEPCSPGFCSRTNCVPVAGGAIFQTIVPFRNVNFIPKNLQSFEGEYICHRISYPNPNVVNQKNFFNCNNPLICPTFPEFDIQSPDPFSTCGGRTWQAENGWDGGFVRCFTGSFGGNIISDYWWATNHTIISDDTFILIESNED
jgi:hypothetical protein